jgi:hypothetical protein
MVSMAENKTIPRGRQVDGCRGRKWNIVERYPSYLSLMIFSSSWWYILLARSVRIYLGAAYICKMCLNGGESIIGMWVSLNLAKMRNHTDGTKFMFGWAGYYIVTSCIKLSVCYCFLHICKCQISLHFNTELILSQCRNISNGSELVSMASAQSSSALWSRYVCPGGLDANHSIVIFFGATSPQGV